MPGQDISDSINFLQNVAAKHFVCLSYKLTKNSQELGHECASCFIVLVDDYWVLITAGHVISRLRQKSTSGIKISYFTLHDKLAGHQYPYGVICSFTLNEWIVIDNDEIDIAAVFLNENEVLSLHKGGIRPCNEGALGSLPHQDYQHLLLAGIPEESYSVENAKTILKLTLIPLRLSEPPSHTINPPSKNKLYAGLLENRENDQVYINDLRGMSGSPIYGVNRIGNQHHCWIIGVQSSWYAQSRIIAFTPFHHLLTILQIYIKENI